MTVKFILKQNKDKTMVEITEVGSKNEFIQQEYQFIKATYGKRGVDYKELGFWLIPFSYNIAKIEMFDGTIKTITFKIPKGYNKLPEE